MANMPRVIDPFREMFSLREDMERVFDSMMGRLTRERSETPWLPAIDVEETDDSVIAVVELPGMRKEDIKVNVVGNTLAISGERKREIEQKNRTYHHIERVTGKFMRTINLPADVDPQGARASYKSGVLELTLPKSARAKAHEIAIKDED